MLFCWQQLRATKYIMAFSYSTRSQSVLTTIQLEVPTMFSTTQAYHERDSFLRHDFSRHALLSCSKILTYQLLGSQLWTASLPLGKSRSPATVNRVVRHGLIILFGDANSQAPPDYKQSLSKSRHNSRTKLCIQVPNVDIIELYLHC